MAGGSRYRFLIATAITVAVIIYGSLYPFEFRNPAGDVGPVAKLVQSWAKTPGRGDFLANILLYIPLGFFAALAAGGKSHALPKLFFVTLAGGLLSTTMELTQYYVEERVTAADDLYANLAGTMAGAITGSLLGERFHRPLLREIDANRIPCLLLAVWLGYRLYPYVPTIDLHKYWNALKPVILYPKLTGLGLFRHMAVWLAVATLIEAVSGPRRGAALFPFFIGAVLVAKTLIVGQTLSASEIAGAAVAFALSILAAIRGGRFRLMLVTLLFGANVIAERLAPFRFTAQRRDFGWIPFFSFMYGSLEVNVMSFLEKGFLYGSLIWLLGAIGLRLRTSAILVAAMLFATSWAETYLPGRSAEITDAVMALLIGVIIAVMQPEPERKGTSVAETS